MTYQEYHDLFDQILYSDVKCYPGYDLKYRQYTRLNQARMRRWDKQFQLDGTLVRLFKSMAQRQHWIIIAEPWCGDAAHILPFLIQLTSLNQLLSYEIQLRDSEPFEINGYLTNGTKSIPKIISRDAHGSDIFVWGPRPHSAQQLVEDMKAGKLDADSISNALQNWYNRDKGYSIGQELSGLVLKAIVDQQEKYFKGLR